MRKCVAAAMFVAGLGIATPDASARQAEVPCSVQAPCAKPFFRDGLYGIRLGSGEVTIPPRFDRAYFAHQRYPKAQGSHLIITEKDGKVGFVSRDGKETEPPVYTVRHFGDGSLIIVEHAGKQCGINRHGVMVLDCKYDMIFATANSNTFFVKENGEARYINASGDTLKFSQPTPSPAPAPAAPAPTTKPAIVMAPVSELEQLVQAKKWDEAIRLAAASNEPRDMRDVLLIFNRTASTSDARYESGKSVLYENIGMIQKATWVSRPLEKSELQRLETAIRAWAEGPTAPSSSFNGYINATTVGECHSRGGSVTVMGRCAN